MARERKYTSKAFQIAVEQYFRSITRRKRLILEEPDLVETKIKGEFKPKKEVFGQASKIYRQPVNQNGEPVEIEEYIIQPTISGICTELEISKQTWSRYSKMKGYAETVERARLRVETYLQDRLMEKNSARGAQFSLQYNFGWNDKPPAEENLSENNIASAVEDMPLKDKIGMLRELGLQLPGEDTRYDEQKTDDIDRGAD